MNFTLPNTTARIQITSLTSGAKTNYWDCTYKVIDKSNDVIKGQEFSVSEFAVPSIETNKELYISQHYQGQIYDGAVWIAAIVAAEE